MKVHQLQEDLVKYAASIGVDKIGFTTAAPFHELKNRLRRQQQLAYQSGFEEANIELRTEPLKLLDEAESIIAIAIACKPSIIIADEPTTALDVTIQAQILDLLKELQAETEAGIILITHDLGVVAEMADRVAVMYAGQIIEEAPVQELFSNPKHPYTRSLFNSIPQMNSENEKLKVIEGMVPSLINLPRKGCRFASRIPWIDQHLHEEEPKLHEISSGHFVRCTCWKHFHFEGEEGGK